MPLDDETVATAKRVWQLNTMMDVPVLDACDLEDLDKNAYYRAKRTHEDDWESDRYFPEDVLERVEALESHVEEKLDPWPRVVVGNNEQIEEIRGEIEELEESLASRIKALKLEIRGLREDREELIERVVDDALNPALVRKHDEEIQTVFTKRRETQTQLEEEIEKRRETQDQLEAEVKKRRTLEERVEELEEKTQKKGRFF